MKTIGVIGGIGPQATMDFEARLHRAAQRRIPAHYNSGYPPLVVYYHRRPPIIVDEHGMPVPPLRPDPALLEAAARIGPMVDFLVITSNGVHRVAGELSRAAGRPVLSMVDRVVEEVSRRQWRRVGLMTLGPPAVYAEPLGKLGIACEALDETRQAALDRAIFTVMEGRADDARKRASREALAELRGRGVDGVIMGCTEVPFLLEPTGAEPDLIDPLELLAEAAVEAAMRTDSSSAAARP
jgi:aspartate racemase